MTIHAGAPPAAGTHPRPLRVLCVTPTGPEGRGGIDRLYRYLRGAGRLGAGDGLETRYLASRGPAEGRRWMAEFPVRAAGFALALARFRPDVVHLNFATGGSLPRKWALARLARAFGHPVVIHFHGQFPLEGIAARDAAGRLFVALCRLADRVVALGEVSRGRFIEAAGVRPERVRVVPNGIADFARDLALPKVAGQGPVRLLLAGEVGERKGVPVLIAALARLPPEAQWTCTVAGNGEVERCRRLAAEAGLSGRVAFTGWTPPEEVHRLMREADIVVLPSLAENMPLSLIEGACAGAALVATPIAETRAIVRDGENGLIVTRDPAAVADALAGLIGDRARLGAMQAASRRHYEESFTLDALADRLAALYREVAGRP
ncbi:D-inositol-3-phosphate glycosyltransferase [Methylobacterium crusticola]|uniref:D-inositol-3-phosphate glycosyltransferase n=1 Tax=Methylobacterium crusticola TaxID=1697972 RepID=A0ABQ4QR45_9HYPH|nr:glycosyltransferase family 4 protein [Methylobacterium crusticola]GJD47484.1 D-inositol-3-phosphate glycosyltransferase [Methylobacterium crusticola]